MGREKGVERQRETKSTHRQAETERQRDRKSDRQKR